MTVTVLAITGRDSLKPEWVRVNGQNVTLTQHTTENLWTGTVTISLMGLVTGEDDFPHYVVTAEHSEVQLIQQKCIQSQHQLLLQLLLLAITHYRQHRPHTAQEEAFQSQ